MTNEYRTESDSMGQMQVPIDAYYGASTARAVVNFPIAHKPVPTPVIHALGHLKAACAQANLDLGKLDPKRAKAIIDASEQVARGQHDQHFPVDVYQTGSGTSTNMNANEVIATLANDILGLGRHVNAEGGVHPNDHVNMGQSSNDTFPAAMHIAVCQMANTSLIPAMEKLADTLEKQAEKWDNIVKIGRTHLMDATPIRVGQVFAGYAQQARFGVARATDIRLTLEKNMPIGGTAVGTGINTHPEFAKRVCDALAKRLNIPFEEAINHCEAQAAKDHFVQAHGMLKTIAISLSKIANDMRHLGSGPRCGIGELELPAIQPGSSIMPGKVNPVICESVMQVTCRVMGNDVTVSTAAIGGVGSLFELNVAMPVMIDAFMESMTLISNVVTVMVDKLLVDLQVNTERCRQMIDQSLMMVTALAPVIGYDTAARLAKRALIDGQTIGELCREENILPVEQLDQLLDPMNMTRPG